MSRPLGRVRREVVPREEDVARVIGTRPLHGIDACHVWVNRSQPFTPHTMGELLGACEDLVRREGRDVFVQRDSNGVLTRCSWPGPRGCSGRCGEGFVLGSWAFGSARAQRGGADGGAR